MATLTNGSEPMADIGATSIYGSELNDFVYLNNASSNSCIPVNAAANGNSGANSEYLFTDLLSDEDLQLMEMSAGAAYPNVTNANYYYHHHRITGQENVTGTEDRMDASSDSAVSSMSSDRVDGVSFE